MVVRWVVVGVLLLAAVTAEAATPEDVAAAKAAYAEGVRRFALREFQTALEAFKQAYLKFESPALLFNIAQCHKELGNRDEAMHFLENYLSLAPEAPDRAEVVKMIAELQAHAQQPPPAATTRRPPPTANAIGPPVVTQPRPARRPVWPAVVGATIGVVVVAGGLGVGLGVGLTPNNAAAPSDGPLFQAMFR